MMNSQTDLSTYTPSMQRLVTLITELEEEASLEELKSMLDQGFSPNELLDCCMEGMYRVGTLFEEGTYFIAALIMAGEIMRSVTEQLTPYLVQEQTGEAGGRILLGTIEGDIHDLGKNLFALLLRCHDFEVYDLGVDIDADSFLSKTREVKPDLIGISCVMTSSIDNLKRTIECLRGESVLNKTPVVIGGTSVDQRIARYVDADRWTRDAAQGIRICKEITSQFRSPSH